MRGVRRGGSGGEPAGAPGDEGGEDEEEDAEGEFDGEGVFFLEVDEVFAAEAAVGEEEDDDEWGDEGEVVDDEPEDGVEFALLDLIDDGGVDLAGAGEFEE